MKIYPLVLLTFVLLSLPIIPVHADERDFTLQPVTYRTAPKGLHRSHCAPVIFARKRHYSKLTLLFVGGKYSSNETLYSDPKCEVSVLDTTSQGNWAISRGTVLNLKANRMQMRPLDPRIADHLAKEGTCGKSWENGVRNEILKTPCGLGTHAQYFVSRSNQAARSLDLYDCEGQSEPNEACTQYQMSPVPLKGTKTHLSRR